MLHLLNMQWILIRNMLLCSCVSNLYEHTWILEVVSKQPILLRGRVGDSTTLVNSLSLSWPRMLLLLDAVTYIDGHFWLIRNEL